MPDSVRDPIDEIARASAEKLVSSVGPTLPALVEARLRSDRDDRLEKFDAGTTIAVAGLIVSVAALAWKICDDLKKNAAAAPSTEVVTRRIRVEFDQLEEPSSTSSDRRREVIDVVVKEIVLRESK